MSLLTTIALLAMQNGAEPCRPYAKAPTLNAVIYEDYQAQIQAAKGIVPGGGAKGNRRRDLKPQPKANPSPGAKGAGSSIVNRDAKANQRSEEPGASPPEPPPSAAERTTAYVVPPSRVSVPPGKPKPKTKSPNGGDGGDSKKENPPPPVNESTEQKQYSQTSTIENKIQNPFDSLQNQLTDAVNTLVSKVDEVSQSLPLAEIQPIVNQIEELIQRVQVPNVPPFGGP